jgi:hypothetical protein
VDRRLVIGDERFPGRLVDRIVADTRRVIALLRRKPEPTVFVFFFYSPVGVAPGEAGGTPEKNFDGWFWSGPTGPYNIRAERLGPFAFVDRSVYKDGRFACRVLETA